MESILARALEYTLTHWLKSFSRDQFKLQGRTVQLYGLDINGETLHASAGFPTALTVTKAKVGKLEIQLPSVSYVQVEPIVIQIDKLDLVLEENPDADMDKSPNSSQTSPSSGRSSGYGFADKIADGMSVEVGQVNLMLETRGGASGHEGATWTPPLASITIRNLLLYTTNENWQVVNLKEARDFSNDKKYIYLFKKLEWESLSIDLLPHPNMFLDERATHSNSGASGRDDDGAKRLFFGGERFLEGISGQAYITVQRTQQNKPLGLEVQLHVSEAVCPSLSEPGLRALLRFMTGLYVCLNRGDIDPKAKQLSTEVAGRSLVAIVVDHIFLCIKDAEFQLELLMQSLCFSRASISDGERTNNMARVKIGGLFLRNMFSNPPCTLIQPSMQLGLEETSVPDFVSDNMWPCIYPLGEQSWQICQGPPTLCLYSLQTTPARSPPMLASETLIKCLPIQIYLQEESFLRIASFLADGIVVNPGAVMPDFSVNSFEFNLKELDLTVPLADKASAMLFSRARLQVNDLVFSQVPTMKFKLLKLEKDPACFTMWEGQPIDASQRKWMTGASHITLSLETGQDKTHIGQSRESQSSLRCVEFHEVVFEAAMTTADGGPLTVVPPPGGIVRIGVVCKQYLSNTSVEQLFFVLDLYTYFGRVSDDIGKAGKVGKHKREQSFGEVMMEKVPSDTAVSLVVSDLDLKFLESSSQNIEGLPLVQFGGDNLFVHVTHRTFGGAVVVASKVQWDSAQVDCVDAEDDLSHLDVNGTISSNASVPYAYPRMRSVFWIDDVRSRRNKMEQNAHGPTLPFLEISTDHMIPSNLEDAECHRLSVSAMVAGIRLGGGMNYTEALLHRFGILGPDGGPGDGLSKSLKHLSEGPLGRLLKPSSHQEMNQKEGPHEENHDSLLALGMPDDVDVSIELSDWLFALEGEQEMQKERQFAYGDNLHREERSWHTAFQRLRMRATSKRSAVNDTGGASDKSKQPVDLVTVGVEGLQAIKPLPENQLYESKREVQRHLQVESRKSGGVDLEVQLVSSENADHDEMGSWGVQNLKFCVKQPIEAIATKEELEYLMLLCRSEADSLGRLVAGVLRTFRLEKSIGHSTINKLSNLGTKGLDKIFTPEKMSPRNSTTSNCQTPTYLTNGGHEGIETTIASLEETVSNSQEVCSSLLSESQASELPAVYVNEIEQLNQKLQSMQKLLLKLRTDASIL